MFSPGRARTRTRTQAHLIVAASLLAGCNELAGIEGTYKLAPSDAGSVYVYHSPGVSKQSCANTLMCGDLSCCAGDPVPGGKFTMGCGAACEAEGEGDYDEFPAHEVSVSDYRLDAFEVTVGRFRAFVQAYGGGWRPMEGAGKHAAIDDTGWQKDWEAKLPDTKDALIESLKCITYKNTWTDQPGKNESYPINCVNWYEAFAFCIWDGGRLPTEAEWEYTAKGGDENRKYAWGSDAPDCTRVHMADCEEAPDAGLETTPYVRVGSRPLGSTRWGHHDIAGSLWEWTFDGYDDQWYGGHGLKCNDCANTQRGPRSDRGGSFYESEGRLFRGSYRGKDFPENRSDWLGFRCARDGT